MHSILSNMTSLQMGGGEPAFMNYGTNKRSFFSYPTDLTSVRESDLLFLLITMMNIPKFLPPGILQLK